MKIKRSRKNWFSLICLKNLWKRLQTDTIRGYNRPFYEAIISKSGNFFKICCNTATLVSTAGRMEDALLLSLGYEELSPPLQKEGKGEVRCKFCRDTYTFNEKELKAILATEPDKKERRGT
jgi:hypothetical protein